MAAETNLATFKLPKEKWKLFQEIAKEKNSNASAMLVEFVDWVIAGNELSSTERFPSLDSLDQLINEKVDAKFVELANQLPTSEPHWVILADLFSKIQKISNDLSNRSTPDTLEELEQRLDRYRIATRQEIEKQDDSIEAIANQVASIEAKLASFATPAVEKEEPTVALANQVVEIEAKLTSVIAGEVEKEELLAAIANQVAEIEAKLGSVTTGGLGKEELQAAKDKVLREWRVARAPEKKERIAQALDKLIDSTAKPSNKEK